MMRTWGMATLLVGSLASATLAAELDPEALLEALAGPDSRGRSIETDLDRATDVLFDALEREGRNLVVQEFAGPDGAVLKNLLVIVEGTQSSAGWIVVGAHYDHLGLGEVGTPHHGTVHAGADDNASGCAVLAGLVQRANEMQNERGVVFAFFSGEEIGLLGSRHFVAQPPAGVGEIVAMVNLDTVGRLRDGGLTVFGVESSRGFADALAGINSGFGLDLKPVARSSGSADDMAFAERGVATLHLFTGAHATYHRPSDTLDALDREGLETLTDFGYELLDYLARSDVEIAFVPAGAQAAVADPARATEGRRRVSFGSIPDFQRDGGGVAITGVIAGSPAAQAGLREGDVIVEFGGAPLDDLTDYSEAMKRHEPGDVVVVVYLRGGERHSVEVTLTERK